MKTPAPSEGEILDALRVLVRGYLESPDEGEVQSLRVTTAPWEHVRTLLNRLRRDETRDHHYSGEQSRGFWARVNALPKPRNMELYACGVLLQNLEETVLRWLADAEREGTP